MSMDSEKLTNCLTCNCHTEPGKDCPIFYTFLRANGLLVADVLETVLLIPDASKLGSDIVCASCYQLIEDFCGLELKYKEVKKVLWELHIQTSLKRDLDITKFIKGAEIQTDPVAEFKSGPVPVKQENEKFEDSKLGILVEAETEFLNENDDNDDFTVDVDPHLPADSDSDSSDQEVLAKKKSNIKIKNEKLNIKDEKVHGDLAAAGDTVVIDGIGLKESSRTCMLCGENYMGYTSLKKHMQHIHPTAKLKYKCRECEKVLTTHGGSLYHGRIHNVFLDDKDLSDVFDFFVVQGAVFVPARNKSKYRSAYIHKKAKSKVLKSIPREVTVVDAVSSSDDDDVPLVKKKKQFIFNKIHEEVLTGKRDGSKSTSINQSKKALAELKKINGIEIRKVSNPVGRPRKVIAKKKPSEHPGDIDMLNEIRKLQEQIDQRVIPSRPKLQLRRQRDVKKGESVGQNIKAPSDRAAYPDGADEDVLVEIMKMQQILDQGIAETEVDILARLPVVKEAKFKCDKCGKMWKTKGELNSHKTTHSDIRPFMCDICGQAYKHKNALDVHVGMHNGVFQHQCPYCKKAFTQKGALQRHLPIHTGDKPFQCELCGKQFVHRTSFSIHTMAHTGVRNIRCNICNLGVLSKSHLRRHIRIHTGEKPYECRSCGKTFAERYNLAAHQRTHDPTLPPTRAPKKKPQHICRLCSVTFTTKAKLDDHMVQDHNKVADDLTVSRPGSFDSTDTFQAPRFVINDSESSRGDSIKSEEVKLSPELVARRNFQALRNIDLMRSSIDGQLVRISAGMMDPPHGWTYLNH